MVLRRRRTIWQLNAMAGIVLAAVTISPQARADGSPRSEGGYYVHAEVVAVAPIVRAVRVAAPREVCWEERVRHRGRHRWRHHRPGRPYVIVEHHCEIRTEYHNQSRIDGYHVTYRYQSRHFTTRKDHHPGKRIRLRVRVEPTAETERMISFGTTSRGHDFICDHDCFDS
jgi:uncharacterized protein YcfJ